MVLAQSDIIDDIRVKSVLQPGRNMNQDQQRGRSASATRNGHLNPSSSVSPHNQPLLNDSYQQAQQPFSNSDISLGGFNQQTQFASTYPQDAQFLDPQSTLLDFGQQYQNSAQSIDVGQHNGFMQAQPNVSSQNPTYFQQIPRLNHNDSADHLSPGSSAVNLNVPSPYSTSSETTSFPSFDLDLSSQALDSSLVYGQQSSQQQQQQQQQHQQIQAQQQRQLQQRQQNHLQHNNSFDPSSLSIDSMAATHSNPTPAHLLHTGMRKTSQSPSPRASPNFQQMNSYTDGSARQRAESLDPASAAFPPQGYRGNEWASGQNFSLHSHRRTPSETFSDMSNHSAQASPYLGAVDGFDVSPMLGAQDPALFDNALGLSQFSLSDGHLSQPHVSPGHSPLVSPNLMPQTQQPLPEYTALNGFGFSPDMGSQKMSNFDSFQSNASEPFPQLNTGNSPGDFGQADIMSPPEINIDFAPPSRQASFGPAAAGVSQDDTLSPPDRSPSRNRTRAKSDSFASTNSRPSSSGMSGRGRSPSLQPASGSKNSLSPHHIRLPTSRSPSPSSNSSAAGNQRSRASSMSAAPQRDYILDLANPERSTGPGNDPKRVQKHPANFQCHLCPKKFTRAYNLRSHLRTHTDERPFVCTVCGKAFARQHDRKRHEGLHSGEKKFVCKGTLSAGEQWGCGRRFARADALGRHFRSEAGRVCIRPLLDEEAAERQRQWQEEQAQQQMQSTQGFIAPGPMTQQPHLQPILPAILLQTYPELASFDWSGTSAAPIPDDMDAYSGHSNYDASSGGEWDGMSENEMSSFGNQQNQQQLNGQQQNMGNGMSNGWSAQSDYLSDY